MNPAKNIDAFLETYIHEDDPTAIMSRQEIQRQLLIAEEAEQKRPASGTRNRCSFGTYSRICPRD